MYSEAAAKLSEYHRSKLAADSALKTRGVAEYVMTDWDRSLDIDLASEVERGGSRIGARIPSAVVADCSHEARPGSGLVSREKTAGYTTGGGKPFGVFTGAKLGGKERALRERL